MIYTNDDNQVNDSWLKDSLNKEFEPKFGKDAWGMDAKGLFLYGDGDYKGITLTVELSDYSAVLYVEAPEYFDDMQQLCAGSVSLGQDNFEDEFAMAAMDAFHGWL